MVVAQKQKYRSMEQDRKPRDKPTHLWSTNLTNEARIYNGEKTVFSISGAGNTRQLHLKKLKIEHSLTPYTKINSKWIRDLNVRLDTLKTLEGDIGGTLFEINHSKIVFDLPPREMEIKTKINKWDLTKLKSFCKAKETTNKMKRQPSEWEKIFANVSMDKDSSPKYINSSCSSILKKQTTQSKNGQNT